VSWGGGGKKEKGDSCCPSLNLARTNIQRETFEKREGGEKEHPYSSSRRRGKEKSATYKSSIGKQDLQKGRNP